MTRSPGGTTQSQILQDDLFRLPMVSISAGRVPGASHLRKFGADPSTDITFQPIWSASVPHVFRSTGVIMTISSDDATDTSGGIGARTVTITGCDQGFNRVTETVTMNGVTPVSTIAAFMIIETITVDSAGSTDANVGKIYAGTGTVTLGVPAVIEAIIQELDGKSLIGWFTVPAGFSGFLMDLGAFVSRSANTNLDVRGRVKLYNKPWQTVATAPLFQNNFIFRGSIPVYFPEKTLFVMEAKGSAAGVPTSIVIDLLLIENAIFDWPST